MLRAILIDDEKSSLQSLEFEIKEYCPEVNIVASCKSPEEGIKSIQSEKPDLIFLDIEMPGMNGFELLQSLDSIAFDVIFVTAYDQFAIKAFEFNAVDYLLKPVLKSKLILAVQKVIDKSEHSFPKADFDALLNNLNLQTSQGIEKIALPTSEGFEFIPINDLTHLKGESNYTWAFLISGKKYLIAKTMKDIIPLISFPQFYRVHKSYVVNLNHVTKYIRGSGGYLVLDGKEQIPVSRAQKPGLMKTLNM
jgi:two-component system LytT family response regulator